MRDQVPTIASCPSVHAATHDRSAALARLLPEDGARREEQDPTGGSGLSANESDESRLFAENRVDLVELSA